MFFNWRAKAKLVLAHLAAIAEVHFLEAIEQLDNLLVGLPESLVVSDDGRVLGCGLPEFAPQPEWILGAFVVEQLFVDLSLTRQLCRSGRRRLRGPRHFAHTAARWVRPRIRQRCS